MSQQVYKRISELQVLNSYTGYYIGRTYYNEQLKCHVPYERCSRFFQTKSEANIAFAYMTTGP